MNQIDCAAARDRLLDADLTELTGPGDLAQHIASCAGCARIARAIVAGYADLDAGLWALRLEPARRPWKRARWLALPLAAAAGFALLLTRHETLPPPPSPLLMRLLFPEQPIVTPPPGMQAMIIERKDATIVWLY